MYAINEEIKFAMAIDAARLRYEHYWRLEIRTPLPPAKWISVL